MRQRIECEGRSARYAVRVLNDGGVLSTDTVSGGGLRGDRSIHMLREYAVAPGLHAFAVEVARTDSAGGSEEGKEDAEDAETSQAAATPRGGRLDRGVRELEERRRQRQERLPPRLRLDTTVTLAPGAVLLIIYDPIERRLVALAGDRQAQRASPASPPAR